MLLLGLLAASINAVAETYIYQEEDGTRWITDRSMDPSRFVFIDKYGRATATRSCKGVTMEMMERRSARFMPIVRSHAARNNVDIQLVKAIIATESCFDPTAISKAGARGLMQLMPATAQRYEVNDRFDPHQNVRAGITHFRDLLDEFRESWELSLAAYNAGAHNVKKYGGIPPFRETQNYVKKVLDYFKHFKAQEEALMSLN